MLVPTLILVILPCLMNCSRVHLRPLAQPSGACFRYVLPLDLPQSSGVTCPGIAFVRANGFGSPVLHPFQIDCLLQPGPAARSPRPASALIVPAVGASHSWIVAALILRRQAPMALKSVSINPLHSSSFLTLPSFSFLHLL